MKNKIEQYIEFGIKNGVRLSCIDGNSTGIKTSKAFVLPLITSKEFIEAVAKGLYNNGDTISVDGLKINDVIETSIGESFYKIDGYTFLQKIRLENRITKDQAIAIRDNKLEEFITNLGIGKAKKNSSL